MSVCLSVCVWAGVEGEEQIFSDLLVDRPTMHLIFKTFQLSPCKEISVNKYKLNIFQCSRAPVLSKHYIYSTIYWVVWDLFPNYKAVAGT